MNREMSTEEIKTQTEILKQQSADKELVLQGLLEILEKQNGIEDDE